MRRFALICLLVISATSYAQDQNVIAQGTAFGKSIAPTQPGQVVNPSGVSSSAWSGKTNAPSQTPTGLGGFSVPQTSTGALDSAKAMGLAGLGNQAMDKCAAYIPGSGDTARDQECAAVNFLSQRCLTPSGAQTTIINKTGINQPQASSDYCKNSYGKGANQFDYSNQIKQGDQVFNSSNLAQKNAVSNTAGSCAPTTVVTKPAEYSQYQCIKTYNSTETTCSQYLKASCPPLTDGCDAGGIVPGSWAGDMATSFQPDGSGNYVLTFGTIADNYWGTSSTPYDRTLTFEIKDVEQIKQFMLTRAAFDDWMLVQINGTTVYVGPYGGDRLETYKRSFFGFGVRYCETCTGPAELNTSWNFGLNIDLKPYLKSGANTIFTRTVVAGGGEGAIQITTRQFCTRLCNISWDNQCKELEAKSGSVLGTP